MGAPNAGVAPWQLAQRAPITAFTSQGKSPALGALPAEPPRPMELFEPPSAVPVVSPPLALPPLRPVLLGLPPLLVSGGGVVTPPVPGPQTHSPTLLPSLLQRASPWLPSAHVHATRAPCGQMMELPIIASSGAQLASATVRLAATIHRACRCFI
jgi:hypothetical protein